MSVSIIRWQIYAYSFRVYAILLCQLPVSHKDIAIYKFTPYRAGAS